MEVDLKSTKIYVFSIFILLSLVILLSIFSFKLFFENVQRVHVPDYNLRLSNLFEKNIGKEILTEELGGKSWDKVCFLGPYLSSSSSVLRFEWDIAQYTDVLRSDGHNVIVFVKEESVEDFIVHKRTKGDFSKLSGLCFSNTQRLIISEVKQVSAI
ncbi:hypothetical protein CXF74_21640 [Psychromonas sp. Urea-02u-13]|nr:hypothetical protein CXF74_21640 [Psychromonas sp. Urea-02u-13]